MKGGCCLDTGVPLVGLDFTCSCSALVHWQSSRSNCRALPGLLVCCLCFAPSLTSHLSDSMQTSRQTFLWNKEAPTEISCCDFWKRQGRGIRGPEEFLREGKIGCTMNFFSLQGWRNSDRWEEGLGVLAKSSFLLVLVSGHAAKAVLSTSAPQAASHHSA